MTFRVELIRIKSIREQKLRLKTATEDKKYKIKQYEDVWNNSINLVYSALGYDYLPTHLRGIPLLKLLKKTYKFIDMYCGQSYNLGKTEKVEYECFKRDMDSKIIEKYSCKSSSLLKKIKENNLLNRSIIEDMDKMNLYEVKKYRLAVHSEQD